MFQQLPFTAKSIWIAAPSAVRPHTPICQPSFTLPRCPFSVVPLSHHRPVPTGKGLSFQQSWYFGCPSFRAVRESLQNRPGSEILCVYSTPPAVNFMPHRSPQKGASRGMITPLWAGADGRDRTAYLGITSSPLCLVSYIGITAPVRNPRFIGAGLSVPGCQEGGVRFPLTVNVFPA